jgi:dUTP pyrophosphatase
VTDPSPIDRIGPADVPVGVRRLPGHDDLPFPAYMSQAAAGLDLAAAVTAETAIAPGKRALIPTGFAISLPPGYEGQVRARSGLAVKHGLCVLNAPGTIDQDYRGEIKVILANLGDEPVVIRRGDRIAQLVVAPVTRARLIALEDLDQTSRGEGGFGHTGTGQGPGPDDVSRSGGRVPE